MKLPEEHVEMLQLLRESNELARANNVLLKKLYRHNIVGFVVRIVWYAVLVGLPFALYFYMFEPYLNAFGVHYESFKEGLKGVPGLQGFADMLPVLFD